MNNCQGVFSFPFCLQVLSFSLLLPRMLYLCFVRLCVLLRLLVVVVRPLLLEGQRCCRLPENFLGLCGILAGCSHVVCAPRIPDGAPEGPGETPRAPKVIPGWLPNVTLKWAAFKVAF